jgi:hypothetical protein
MRRSTVLCRPFSKDSLEGGKNQSGFKGIALCPLLSVVYGRDAGIQVKPNFSQVSLCFTSLSVK